MPEKIVVQGKVDKDKTNNKKFKIKKDKASEVDIDIEIEDDGSYDVDKLSVEGLPTEIEGQAITWLNNFAIKKAGNYINQRYKVKIPGMIQLLFLNVLGFPKCWLLSLFMSFII